MKKIITIVLLILWIGNTWYWFGAEYNALAYHTLAFILLTYLILEINISFINRVGDRIFGDN